MFRRYKKFLNWGASTFGVAIIYILGVLIFREGHPFSKFPMYSHFPNWAYSFYLTDENGEIIPFTLLETKGAAIGHLYGNVSDELNIPYGNFSESNNELKKIGDRILNILLKSKELDVTEVNLFRKAFFYKNDSIHNQIDLMISYEIH